MSGHEQFAEDLALYALGSLSGDERATLEKHLEGCASCRRELEQLRGDTSLLALSTAGPKPPMRARERLLAAIAQEPRAESQPASSRAPARRAWWMPVPWLATAALAIAVVWLWRQSDQLSLRVAELQREAAGQQAQLERAREVVQTLTATDALRVTLVAANTPPQPQGKAIYVRDRGSLLFLASNLPALPPQKAYELWLIPVSGAPIPAGVFKPDTQGSATVLNPPLPVGLQAKAFAITVEPEAGSSAPTSPIVMMGAGE
jgi:anti-sigma-K factor RskA